MAEVHRGWDTRLNREVAIKVLRADLARDPTFLTRFRREAHSAAGLNHPAIVSVYDTGEDAAPDGTGIPFIVMEFVEGRTLRDVLKTEGRLPARRAMEIVADICNALDFSHRNGIIHRDIKPANVMITRTGAVKVMDFGIARAVADTSATVTQTANVIGTAQYLSPEQARGEAVDARSDVYSTGCLLYELVTGSPPFQGDSPVAVAYQHVRENPVAPSARNPEVPRAVDSIVMKALAKNPLNRYQTAGEMRADLQRALGGQPVLAETVMTDAERTQFIARTPPPVPMGRPVYPPGRGDDREDRDDRRTGLIWAAVVLALILVVGAAVFVIFGTGSDSPAAQPVTLRSVVGQTEQAAIAAIRRQGLIPRDGGSTSGPCAPQVAKGNVCRTSPSAGQSVDKGSTVSYYLFSPRTVQVPPVQGLSFTAASVKLHAAQLVPVQKLVFSTETAGTVVKQETPQFQDVPPHTKIVLDVSRGKIKLPKVRGLDFETAKAKLNARQFIDVHAVYVVTRVSARDGKVFAEDPSPGIGYPTSTRITLRVWRYEPPQPVCTTSVLPPPATTTAPTSPTAPSSPTNPRSPGAGSSSSSSTSESTTPSPETSPSSTVICTTPTG
jgi:eukaryotic-like serine/threonine-protein kinase